MSAPRTNTDSYCDSDYESSGGSCKTQLYERPVLPALGIAKTQTVTAGMSPIEAVLATKVTTPRQARFGGTLPTIHYSSEIPWSLLNNLLDLGSLGDRSEISSESSLNLHEYKVYFAELEGQTQSLQRDLISSQEALSSLSGQMKSQTLAYEQEIREYKNTIETYRSELSFLRKERDEFMAETYFLKQQAATNSSQDSVQQEFLSRELAQAKLERDKKIGECYVLEKQLAEKISIIDELNKQLQHEERPRERLEKVLNEVQMEKESLTCDLIKMKMQNAEKAFGELEAQMSRTHQAPIVSTGKPSDGLAALFRSVDLRSARNLIQNNNSTRPNSRSSRKVPSLKSFFSISSDSSRKDQRDSPRR